MFSTHDTTKMIQYVQFHRFAYSYASERKKKLCNVKNVWCFGSVFLCIAEQYLQHFTIERIMLTLVNALGIGFNNEQHSSQHLLTLVNVKYSSLLVHNA